MSVLHGPRSFARWAVGRHGLGGGGALVAAAVAAVWLVVGLAMTALAVLYAVGASARQDDIAWLPVSVGAMISIGAAASVPVVAVLGRYLGVAAVLRWGMTRSTLTMALGSVVLTAVVIALVLALVAATQAGPGGLIWGIFYLLYGLVLFGLPGLVLALPSAFVWSWLMRTAAA